MEGNHAERAQEFAAAPANQMPVHYGMIGEAGTIEFLCGVDPRHVLRESYPRRVTCAACLARMIEGLES